MIRTAFLGFLVAALAACASVTSPPPPDELLGLWKEIESEETALLHFKADGSYDVDVDGNLYRDTWGDYQVRDRRITFQDTGGRIGTGCQAPGTYQYLLEDGVLTFELIQDSCMERRAKLASSWVRVARDSAFQ